MFVLIRYFIILAVAAMPVLGTFGGSSLAEEQAIAAGHELPPAVNRLPVTFDQEVGYRVQFEKVRGVPAPMVIGPPAELTQEKADPAIAEEPPPSPSEQEGP